MIKKALFILISLPSFLPSCPEIEGKSEEIAIYEEAKAKELKVSKENTLPLKSSPRPQVILSPPQEPVD